MHKSSYDKTGKMVIAEVVSRSNEVLHFPPKAEQVGLTNKQTNKQNVNGKPAGLFLPEGPAPFARTPLLSKRP